MDGLDKGTFARIDMILQKSGKDKIGQDRSEGAYSFFEVEKTSLTNDE